MRAEAPAGPGRSGGALVTLARIEIRLRHPCAPVSVTWRCWERIASTARGESGSRCPSGYLGWSDPVCAGTMLVPVVRPGRSGRRGARCVRGRAGPTSSGGRVAPERSRPETTRDLELAKPLRGVSMTANTVPATRPKGRQPPLASFSSRRGLAALAASVWSAEADTRARPAGGSREALAPDAQGARVGSHAARHPRL